MDNCIFCKIVAGQIDSAKLWEDQKHLAILDANPNLKGMTLVLTKQHFDSYAFDMPEQDYMEFFVAAKKVAGLLEKGLGVHRVGLVMEGLGVNHAHIKLYPLNGLEGKFNDSWDNDRVFFEKYNGYITTLRGPEAKPEDLKKLANEILTAEG